MSVKRKTFFKAGFTTTPERGAFGVCSASTERGFTLVELTVVTVMMGLLLSVVLANFRVNEKRTAVNESAELIASSLRQMQNNTLAGLPLADGSPANKYSVEFLTSSPTQYTMYVYSDDDARTAIETGTLVTGVNIANLQAGGSARTSIEIQFRPPFAAVYTRMSGVVQIQPNINTTLGVIGTTGYAKNITIEGVSGRIDIQ